LSLAFFVLSQSSSSWLARQFSVSLSGSNSIDEFYYAGGILALLHLIAFIGEHING